MDDTAPAKWEAAQTVANCPPFDIVSADWFSARSSILCSSEGAAMQLGTVIVERRFLGPPNSANGGYACGLIGGFIDGSAEVTLRRSRRVVLSRLV